MSMFDARLNLTFAAVSVQHFRACSSSMLLFSSVKHWSLMSPSWHLQMLLLQHCDCSCRPMLLLLC